MGIAEGDELDIREVDGTIVLAKHDQACALCGSTVALVDYRNRSVCRSCITELGAL